MEITDYELTLTCRIDEIEFKKQLIYRGNENIIIRSWTPVKPIEWEQKDGLYSHDILIPRNILEKFLEIIDGD